MSAMMCDTLHPWVGCQNRRCEHISWQNFESVDKKALKADVVGNYYSGGKSCYRQVQGQYNGCYRQDASYKDEAKRISFQESWGECADACNKNPECNFWTWASSSCRDCHPEHCNLFQGGEDGQEPEIGEHEGHISGPRECVDIDYVETDVFKIVPRLDWLLDLDFPVGMCQTEAGAQPPCPAQEVPGYRYQVTGGARLQAGPF